jgi:hypothetical protein
MEGIKGDAITAGFVLSVLIPVIWALIRSNVSAIMRRLDKMEQANEKAIMRVHERIDAFSVVVQHLSDRVSKLEGRQEIADEMREFFRNHS